MKIARDAFHFYAALGPGRSYQAVADHYRCSKRSVTKRALAEGWQDKLQFMEKEAGDQTRRKLMVDFEEVNNRHMKMYQAVQAKALEALKNVTLKNALDAVRALDIGIKGERLLRGEPEKVTTVNIEERIKLEYQHWITTGNVIQPRVIETSPVAGARDGKTE